MISKTTSKPKRGKVQFKCASLCAFSCSQNSEFIVFFCIEFLFHINIICNVYELKNYDFIG